MSSVLLVILLVMTLFDTDDPHGKSKVDASSASLPWLNPRLILFFTTLFGWFSVVAFHFGLSNQQNVLFSGSLSFLLVFLPAILKNFRKSPTFGISVDLKGAVLSTGQVLQPIPPNSNGLGKVQLDHRQTHLEVDAITTGQEIQPGSPVRVVDVIDNRILVVEPLKDDLPPDGGLVRTQS